MNSTTKALSDHDRRIFHHNFAVTTLLVSADDCGETESAMTFADHERNVCFINDAKEQRHWLSCELSNLDSCSENYKTNQLSIRGAIRELDKVIWIATLRPGAWRLAPNDSPA